MNCTNCGGEIADTANFCRHCGTAQQAVPTEEREGPESGEGTESDATSEQLRAAVISLESQVRSLTVRISSLENALLSRPSVVSNASVERAPAPAARSTDPQPVATPASPVVSPPDPSAFDSQGEGSSAVPPGYYASGPALWSWELVDRWELAGPHRHPGRHYWHGLLPQAGF